MKLVHNLRELADRRRELRKNQTLAEQLLWQELRGKKFGYRFHRQYSIGGYILDFYCPKQRLIIEIDGSIHESRKNYDSVRDKYFQELNYKVLRFKNSEAEEDLLEVVNQIQRNLTPSPKSRRGLG